MAAAQQYSINTGNECREVTSTSTAAELLVRGHRNNAAALTPPHSIPNAHVSTHPARKQLVSRLERHESPAMRRPVAVRGRRRALSTRGEPTTGTVSLKLKAITCGGNNERLNGHVQAAPPPPPGPKNLSVHGTIGRSLKSSQKSRLDSTEYDVPPPPESTIPPTLRVIHNPLEDDYGDDNDDSPHPLEKCADCSRNLCGVAAQTAAGGTCANEKGYSGVDDDDSSFNNVFGILDNPVNYEFFHDGQKSSEEDDFDDHVSNQRRHKRLRRSTSPRQQQLLLLHHPSTPVPSVCPLAPVAPPAPPAQLPHKSTSAFSRCLTAKVANAFRESSDGCIIGLRGLRWLLRIIGRDAAESDFWKTLHAHWQAVHENVTTTITQNDSNCRGPATLAFILSLSHVCDAAAALLDLKTAEDLANESDERCRRKMHIESAIIQTFITRTPGLWCLAAVYSLKTNDQKRASAQSAIARLFEPAALSNFAVDARLAAAAEYLSNWRRQGGETSKPNPNSAFRGGTMTQNPSALGQMPEMGEEIDDSNKENAPFLSEWDVARQAMERYAEVCASWTMSTTMLKNYVTDAAAASEVTLRKATRLRVLRQLWEQESVCTPMLHQYAVERINERAEHGMKLLQAPFEQRSLAAKAHHRFSAHYSGGGRISLLLWNDKDWFGEQAKGYQQGPPRRHSSRSSLSASRSSLMVEAAVAATSGRRGGF